MGLLIDLHLHTRRHSRCSSIDEYALIQQAVDRGLDGVVITEHHYQWSQDELDELIATADAPNFLVLTGFEYTSAKGDMLIYGLEPEQVEAFEPGRDPEAMLQQALDWGAACIAAHPTRAEVPFDERIADMPFHGLEVQSVNIQPHEQRLAKKLAQNLEIPPTSASDAHRIQDVGAYAMEFDDLITSMADLRAALKRGRFRLAGSTPTK
jgi:predicted metal-dependent phosphoesterase TrpH